MPQESSSILEPLRNPAYRSYWLTGLSANFGWLIQVVGISWLMMSIGGSTEMVAMVQTALAVPSMLFSLVAGAMADNFGRRTMVLWSQGFLLVASSLLALVTWFGFITPWSLLLFTFVIGAGKAFNNPGWQTFTREFVPPRELPAAIGLNSVGFNIARSLGPAIGGGIVAVVGAFAAFVISALSNVGMMLFFLRTKGSPRESDLPPEPVIGAMMSGLRYVAMSPHLLLVTSRGVIFNIGSSALMALMPVIARDMLNGGPEAYGFLFGGFGVGAVIGAFAGVSLRQRMQLETLVRFGFAGVAVATLAIAFSPNVIIAMLGCVVAGTSWLIVMSTFNTSVQLTSPRWVLSRCHAIYQSAAFAGSAVGSWFWGWLANGHSIEISLYVSAAVIGLGVLAGVLMPLRELNVEGLDPHNSWRAPHFKLDLQPQSGPILTTIEYEIDEADEKAFLKAMQQRRRTRMRDGAKRWNLSRDIVEPGLWIERYQTPTWVDTLRHHQRRTQADLDSAIEVRSLHRGKEPPMVRHHLIRPAGRGGVRNSVDHSDHDAEPINH